MTLSDSNPPIPVPVFEDVGWEDLRFTPESHPGYEYEGFQPGTSLRLPRGHVFKDGYGAFPVETILDIDSEVPMRDGVKIYTNVYRPADGQPQPALIAWGPYGKCAGGHGPLNYDSMGPFRIGIPYDSLSGYETFEGPNPADWVSRGYCVVDPDARGAMHSEGNIAVWGPQEAVDVYDLIEWCTKQPWCDGTAVMFGNSWLAISQINHASRYPHPALKAIAPWEAATNIYKQTLCRGGITTEDALSATIAKGLAGYNKIEGTFSAVKVRPLYDDYWESKRIPVEKIRIPMYQTASYSTRLHSEGSFQTFAKANPDTTWLRVHNSQEWNDLYKEENMDELQKFYDHYAKGKDNGWTQTPHMRLTLLAMAGSVCRSVVERPENANTYPLPQTKVEKLFFDSTNMTLGSTPPAQEASVSYEGHSLKDQVAFEMKFDKYTELSGLPWAKLCVSCKEHDDMDIHILIRKTGVNGKLLSWNNYPVPVPVHKLPDTNIAKFEGCNGCLRASHTISQEPKSHPDDYPTYTHRIREAIQPGSVAAIEIPLWPIGMVFAQGEGISVIIAGHDLKLPETEMGAPKEPIDDNRGRHTVHTGVKHESFLMLPYLKN